MARYEKVTGVIESIGRTGKIIKLDDGEWYSAYKPDDLNGAEEGDEVEFNMEARESGGKTYLNIKGKVTVLGGGGGGSREAPARTERPGGRGGDRQAPPRGRGSSRGGGEERTERSSAGRGEAAQGGGSGGRSQGAEARERSIQRQVALKAAVDFYKESAEATIEEVLVAAGEFAKFLEE
jgi:hypothetical protein